MTKQLDATTKGKDLFDLIGLEFTHYSTKAKHTVIDVERTYSAVTGSCIREEIITTHQILGQTLTGAMPAAAIKRSLIKARKD